MLKMKYGVENNKWKLYVAGEIESWLANVKEMWRKLMKAKAASVAQFNHQWKAKMNNGLAHAMAKTSYINIIWRNRGEMYLAKARNKRINNKAGDILKQIMPVMKS